MKKKLKNLVSTVLCIAILFGMMPLNSQAAEPSSSVMLYTEGILHEAQTREVLKLVNAERSKVGVAPLVMTGIQEEIAEQRALELIALFSHDRPNGTSCFSIADEVELGYGAAGENIALGQRNAAEVMDSWMNSQGHRENILNPDFTHIGIGCFEYLGYKYWVQFFTGNPSDTEEASASGSDGIDVQGVYELDTNAVSGVGMEFYEAEAELVIGKTIDFDLCFFSPNAWDEDQFIGVPLSEYLDDGAVVSSGNKVFVNDENQIQTVDGCKPGTDTLTVRVGNLAAQKKINVVCNHNYENGFCTICGAEKPAIIDVSGGTWKKNSTGWWYELKNGDYLKDCKARISGKVYMFNRAGYIVTGWVKEDGNWYYYDTSGAMAIGWKSISGKWYYMDSQGRMLTGKQEIGNATYYFTASGAMLTGWMKEDDGWHYYDTNGAMIVNGWKKVSNKWYYISEGVMVTGKQEIGTNTYNFTSSGEMVTGWIKEDANWYYYSSSGAMAKGWSKIANVWYYFDPGTGIMYANQWLNDTYYLKSNGAMATGWLSIDGDYYYFDASGAKVRNKWVGNYYLQDDGKMAKDKWIGNYYVDETGKWVPHYGEASSTVYWTPGGKSYHNSNDCTALKRSTDIRSGSLSDAYANGKTDPCNLCVK